MTKPRVLNKKTDRIPPGAVYCGRPSPLGNPFVIGRDGTRSDVIAKYEQWIMRQPQLLARLDRLKGRDLACWCAPLACHCDVLVRLANQPGPAESKDGDEGLASSVSQA